MKKKLMAMLLTGCMAMTMFPMSALAAEDPETNPQSGATMNLAGADVLEITKNADITKTDMANVSISVAPSTALEWVEAAPSIGRSYDGWWIGFKAVAPSSITQDKLSSVKYRNNGDMNDKTTFATSNDGKEGENYYIQLWGGTAEQYMQSGRTIKYTWYFNWDGDDTTGTTIAADQFKSTDKTATATAMTGVDQVITLSFECDKLTLKKGETTVWAPVASNSLSFNNFPNSVTTIFEQQVSKLGTFDIATDETAKKVTVTGSANYVEWAKFNESDLTEQKGHYLPIQIKLPDGMGSLQYEKAKLTVKGSKEKEHTGFTIADHGKEMAMFLDKLTEKKFTVTCDGVTYTVDCSGVALLPEVKTEGDATKVEIPATEADNLGNLIKDAEISGDGTTGDAPVKVEVSGGNKTLTFDGTAGTEEGAENKGHVVTLPSALAANMGTAGGDSEADVKVNSGVGSVTIPSTALAGADADVTVSIKEAKNVNVNGDNIQTEGEALTSDEKDAIKAAVAAATGVTVKATKGPDSLLGTDNEDVVTITITNLDSSKTYELLCVSNDSVTSFGEYKNVTSLTIKSKHLTDFIPVEKTPANQAALNKVKADAGKVEETPAPSALNITFTPASNSIGPKATVTGLTQGTATVQIAGAANKAPAVIFTMTPSAGKIEFNVNANSEVTVWDGTVTFASGQPNAGAPESETATAQ